jgi:hypothetical protein
MCRSINGESEAISRESRGFLTTSTPGLFGNILKTGEWDEQPPFTVKTRTMSLGVPEHGRKSND